MRANWQVWSHQRKRCKHCQDSWFLVFSVAWVYTNLYYCLFEKNEVIRACSCIAKVAGEDLSKWYIVCKLVIPAQLTPIRVLLALGSSFVSPDIITKPGVWAVVIRWPRVGRCPVMLCQLMLQLGLRLFKRPFLICSVRCRFPGRGHSPSPMRTQRNWVGFAESITRPACVLEAISQVVTAMQWIAQNDVSELSVHGYKKMLPMSWLTHDSWMPSASATSATICCSLYPRH